MGLSEKTGAKAVRIDACLLTQERFDVDQPPFQSKGGRGAVRTAPDRLFIWNQVIFKQLWIKDCDCEPRPRAL